VRRLRTGKGRVALPPLKACGRSADGQITFRFTEVVSSPKPKNISLLWKANHWHILAHPALVGRASAVVTDVGRGAVDVEVVARRARPKRTAKACGPDAALLASMLLGAFDFPGRYGGKRAVLRGEHAINRKAIAQGMSDVLRCPVCSCAFCSVHDAHETAGAARIRHSLRPRFEEGGEFLAKLGRIAQRDTNTCLFRHPEPRALRRTCTAGRASRLRMMD